MSATNLRNTELASLDSRWNLGCLVRVKAQVMTRDDSTGMWVPLSGGGMSIVSLHRILVPRIDDEEKGDDDVAYVILGQRIADKSMALNCELLSDLKYTSVNPTFHHWTTNSKRFGLTFQTSSDASSFQRNIERLLEENIREGLAGSKAQALVTTEEVLNVLQQTQISAENMSEELESNAGMRMEGSSSSNEVSPQTSPRPQSITPHVYVKQHPPSTSCLSPLGKDLPPGFHPQTQPRSPLNSTSDTTGVTLGDYGFYVDVSANADGDKNPDIWLEGHAKDLSRKLGLLSIPSDENDDLIYISGSYVQFAKTSDPEKHEYYYPSLDSFKFPPYGTMAGPPHPAGGPPRQTNFSTSVPVPLPMKSRRKWLQRKKKPSGKSCSIRHRPQTAGPKSRCIYCEEYFTSEENRPGACKDAPDRILACIKAATCVCCQEAIAYHCKGDDEEPDDGDRLDCGFGSRGGGCRKRAMLVLICLVVPCLWCYLPLRMCHRFGVACGCYGPRHKAM